MGDSKLEKASDVGCSTVGDELTIYLTELGKRRSLVFNWPITKARNTSNLLDFHLIMRRAG